MTSVIYSINYTDLFKSLDVVLVLVAISLKNPSDFSKIGIKLMLLGHFPY